MTIEKIRALALDGPAGSGKSTVAKSVAAELKFVYIDTGAMYRALALKAARQKINWDDVSALAALAKQTEWRFDELGAVLYLDGENVSAAIRSPEVTSTTKFVARVPAVREHLVNLQRQMATINPSVMEGRDITTVVLPNARWRIFLTARPEIRATRRLQDFNERGFAADYAKILEEINARDASDFAIGPMKEAMELAKLGEIILLDTSDLSSSEVIARLTGIVKSQT